jgi:ribonuclease HI
LTPRPVDLSNFEVVAYIDGGARGNPGPAGYGVRIENPDGTLVEEFGAAIGVATNNVAEYRGLIAALEWARGHGYSRLLVRSDSLLLVQQMLGNYKVKHPGLQPLYARARLLSIEIGRVDFEHIERARNAHADRLANAAMDNAVASPQSAVNSQRSSVASAESSVSSVESAVGRARSSAATHPFTSVERTVRLFIYRHFLETGEAPDTATIARGTRVSEEDVATALRRLADMHAIVLAPASVSIWMAHPFSAVPTAYPVDTNGRRYWANCAWDAAGILSLVGADGESRTRCADCGTELTMTVRDGAIASDGVVHYAVPPRRFWENIAYT